MAKKKFRGLQDLYMRFECKSCGKNMKNSSAVCDDCTPIESIVILKNSLPVHFKLIEKEYKCSYIGDFVFHNNNNKLISLFYTDDIRNPYIGFLAENATVDGRIVIKRIVKIKPKNIGKLRFKSLLYNGTYYLSTCLKDVIKLNDRNEILHNGYLNPKTTLSDEHQFVELFIHKDKFYIKNDRK